MPHLPHDATDDDLIAFADRWVRLMKARTTTQLFAFHTAHSRMKWTPTLVRDVIKSYGDAAPDQRVTLLGAATISRNGKRLIVVEKCARDRWKIWYDLNIDGGDRT